MLNALDRRCHHGSRLTLMSIFDQALGFIRRPRPEAFEPLALSIFRYQFENVPAYRSHCESLKLSPEQVGNVDQIPLVSTIAFKYAVLGASNPERIFLTSGTTLGDADRGWHFVARLDLYRESALAHFKTMMLPDCEQMLMLALHPRADSMPHSSLAQMISWCIEQFGAPGSQGIADRNRVSIDSAIDFLSRAERSRQPVCVLGTTAVFGDLFRRLLESGKRLALPPGSRLMDTGGPKGQTNPLAMEEVFATAAEWLGISSDFVINEYGMTELCSQLYDITPLNSPGRAPSTMWRVKSPPPWLHVRIVNPTNLQTLPAGAPGLVAFFDIANAGSVSAILTEDIGITDGGAIRLIGRAAASEARGCALALGAES
jgi:hypothetical protein